MDPKIRPEAGDLGPPRPTRTPLIVAYGMGLDSTAVLVGLWLHNERPDLVLFADTGSEKPETYRYLATIDWWLHSVGFPPVTVVKRGTVHGKQGDYDTLEGNCLVNQTLPSLAFFRKSCSIAWKVTPQDKFCRQHPLLQAAWAAGVKPIKCIGYDCGKADMRRKGKVEDAEYVYRYPLREWGLDREAARELVGDVGLPIPPKSACFFCPASKPHELVALGMRHPELLQRAIAMEDRAAPKLVKIGGLWSKPRKTMGLPASWRAYAEQEGLPLPEDTSDQVIVKRLRLERRFGTDPQYYP